MLTPPLAARPDRPATTTPGANPSLAAVKIWGATRSPRWSVTVVETTTDEEMAALVERAVAAYRQVGRLLREGEPEP